MSDNMAITTPRRRLYRSRDVRIVGGVCGGFAEYLDIDVAITRIIALAITFTGGGFLLYLIAWIIIPDEPRKPEHPPGISMPVRHPTAPPRRNDQSRWIVGGILVALGSWLVVRNLGEQIFPWFDDLVLPMVLIAVGTAVVVYAMRK